jgi:site-specific recombinase XerC
MFSSHCSANRFAKKSHKGVSMSLVEVEVPRASADDGVTPREQKVFQELLGHVNLATTAIYAHVEVSRLRAAVNRLR